MIMGYEPVDFYFSDSSPQALPVSGVVVKVYSSDGLVFFSQQTSNTNGVASFLLPAGSTYQARFFKLQASIRNPQSFEVIEAPVAPVSNDFNITVDLLAPPTVPDQRLCVCHGFFRTVTGAPAKNLSIHIVSEFNPLLLEGSAVMTEREIVRTDDRGYVQVSLIRYGQYRVTVEGMEDVQRLISVPDAPNVNLPDLLFPVVGGIIFDPTPPYVLAVDESVTVTPLILATNGEELDLTSGDIIWSIDDESVAAFYLEPPNIRFRGVGPGTTQFKAVRANNSIVRIPDPGILGVPVTITVS